MKDRMKKHMKFAIDLIEMAIGAIVAITIIVAIPDLLKYIVVIIKSSKGVSYEVFGEFLKHVLMLVVGLELMLMIITHSHESILTLVLFVIARKMLVYAEGMTEIFVGTLSIAVIFFAMRFFAADDKMMAKFDNTFSAAVPVEKIRREYGYDIPTDISHTLGGLIYELCTRENLDIEEGLSINHKDVKYTLVSVSDGVIERVLLEEKVH